MKILSIAWAESSRIAETLALRLGAEFRLLACARTGMLERPLQYLRLERATRSLIAASGPDLVIVQHPPVHAVAAVVAACRQIGADFCIDAHSGAFLLAGPVQALYRRRFARLGQQALVTLIHNEDLIPAAEELGLRYLVLEMAVPELPTAEVAEINHPAAIVISGGGDDEPLDVLRQAARLRPEVKFYLTGPARIGPAGSARVTAGGPGEIARTGFLAGDAYWRMLNAADVIVVLTRREATILSGAYEGLAAGRPLVLSRTETLMRAFSRGAVLVENTSESLAEGIDVALRTGPELVRQGQELKADKARTWERQFRVLQGIISERRGRSRFRADEPGE